MRSPAPPLFLLMTTLACGTQAPATAAGAASIPPPDAVAPPAAAPVLAPDAPVPAPASNPLAPAPSTSIDAQTCAALIDQLATSVAVLYVFPELGALMERELRGRLSVGEYSRWVDAAALAEALTADLQVMSHDLHLRVMFSPNGPPQHPPGSPMAASGISKIEVLDGNIGYIALDGVPPLDMARSGIEAAFAQLLHTNALILDNRNNHGGDPNTVALYVSYLSEGPPVVINTFHPRDGQVEEFRTTDLGARSYGVTRPVFVLTSGETFSGGEELSYDLQASRRAVLIGERTGGGANPARVLPLRNGFAAQIPFAQPINPITGKNWEGVGVTPDVAVPAERALDEALVRARAAAAQRRSSGPSASSGPSPSSARAPSTR